MENLEPTQEEIAAEIKAGYEDSAESAIVQNEPVVEETAVGKEAGGDDPWSTVPEVIKAEFNALKEKARNVDKLEARLRKSEGHIGDLIKSIKRQPTPEQLEAAKLAKEKQEQIAARMGKLEEFDPEIADVIKATREEITERFAGIPDVAKVRAELETDFTARLSTVQKGFENRLVSFFHPKWEQKIATDDFKNFMESATPEVKALAASTRAEDAVSSTTGSF